MFFFKNDAKFGNDIERRIRSLGRFTSHQFSLMNTFVLTELFGTLTFYVEAPLRRFTRAICGLRNVVLLCEVLQSIAFVAAFAELWCSESVVELERIHRLFFTAIGYKLCHFFYFHVLSLSTPSRGPFCIAAPACSFCLTGRIFSADTKRQSIYERTFLKLQSSQLFHSKHSTKADGFGPYRHTDCLKPFGAGPYVRFLCDSL